MAEEEEEEAEVEGEEDDDADDKLYCFCQKTSYGDVSVLLNFLLWRMLTVFV
jgi:hypothetical protein